MMTTWEYFYPSREHIGWLKLESDNSSSEDQSSEQQFKWARVSDLSFDLHDVARVDVYLPAKAAHV